MWVNGRSKEPKGQAIFRLDVEAAGSPGLYALIAAIQWGKERLNVVADYSGYLNGFSW